MMRRTLSSQAWACSVTKEGHVLPYLQRKYTYKSKYTPKKQITSWINLLKCGEIG